MNCQPIPLICGLLGVLCGPLSSSGQTVPAWWPVESSGTPHDFRPATVGQLKNMAFHAMQEFNHRLTPFNLPGRGAGDEVARMVAGWMVVSAANAHAINQGQLKAVAQPFYDRMSQLGFWPRGWVPSLNAFGATDTAGRWHRISVGSPENPNEWALTPRYPWKFWQRASFWVQHERATLRLQPANVGQLKAVMNFDPLTLLRNSGLILLDGSGNPVFDGAGHVTPMDTDGDGFSDLIERLHGTDSTQSSSAPSSANPFADVQKVTGANPDGISDAAAARFLAQATWGPSLDSLADLKSKGLSTWIDEQMDENDGHLGFRPNQQGMTQVTWRDNSTSHWQVLWFDDWTGHTSHSPKDSALLINYDIISGRPDEYWEPNYDSAAAIFPILFASGDPNQQGIILSEVNDRRFYIHGEGGLVSYLQSLVNQYNENNPSTPISQETALSYWHDGYTPPGASAIPGTHSRQTSAVFARLDGRWLMTDPLNASSSLPYASYTGPAANVNSSDYPSQLLSPTGNTAWAALRDAADPAERGPYLDTAFPKRGLEPYMFYCHWRKMVLDRPLWLAAFTHSWLAPGFVPPLRTLPWPYAFGSADPQSMEFTGRQATAGLEDAWLRRALYDPDQLRQRMAWALSQIIVASNFESFAQDRIGLPAAAHFYDLLNYRAFRRFEDLLLDVTFHPLMAHWLTYIGSDGATDPNDTRLHPDENYAREIMQLFSMGLNQLHDDGTPSLDADGNKLPTYTQEDIRQLARVFTGMVSRSTNTTADCLPLSVQATGAGPGHDARSKTFLGLHLPAQTHTAATAEAEIRQAVRHIASRPSVAPYICRQLIQHLVTSNPSPSYVKRVVTAWRTHSNASDHLGRVIRAILMDAEARSADTALAGRGSGRLRDPLQRQLSLMRAFHAGADYGRGDADITRAEVHPLDSPSWGWGHYLADPMHWFRDAQQYPMGSPSVFSFYEPAYSPAGEVYNARLRAPEFQILNSATAAALTQRLWLDTDFHPPATPLRVTAQQAPLSVGSRNLLEGELILHYIHNGNDPAFRQFSVDPAPVIQQGSSSLPMPHPEVEGFRSQTYHSTQREALIRLWHDPPYTTPGSSLSHQNKALRLHFGPLDTDGDSQPDIHAPVIENGDASKYITQLDTLLCAGRMSSATRTALLSAINSAAPVTGDPHYKERAALQLLLMTPEASLIR